MGGMKSIEERMKKRHLDTPNSALQIPAMI
jgi:hypothetical protein